MPGTVNSNLRFTDNLYDIGASGATRPRSLFLSTNITVGSLTSTRVPYASTGGLLVDSANMTFNGTRLTVADLADSGLTSGRVTYASSGGALVDSANLLFDGTTLTANALTTTSTVTINGGTANGVAYLNGSKVLTTGSALTFDGTLFSTTGGISLGASANLTWGGAYGAGIPTIAGSSGALLFYPTGSTSGEAMRLNSSGDLGIGTSSPNGKLTLQNASVRAEFGEASGASYIESLNNARTASVPMSIYAGSFNVFTRPSGSYSQNLTLDSSGNLGLGVTPSAWTVKAVEIGAKGTAIWNLNQQNASFTCNAYYDGTLRYGGTGLATQYQQAAGLHYWYTAASGTAGNAISFTQAMTLDASGNLIVGGTSALVTASGRGNVTINGASSSILSLGVGGSYRTYLFTDGTNTELWNGQAGNLVFGTNNTERARIDSSGNLLVGTTNTSASAGVGTKIRYDASSPDISIVCSASTNSFSAYNLYSTGAGAFRFYVGLGGTIFATSTTISAISDQRLKENVQDLDVGLNAVLALKPRKFDWKSGKGKDIKGDRGWIAQEFEQVFPDLIDEWKDPAPEGEEPYKSVRADLIPVLVKAIQEQQALITSLTARIAALEAK